MVHPPMMPTLLVAVLIAAASVAARGEQTASVAARPVVFDGFGFGDFQSSGSIAAALRGVVPEEDFRRPSLDVIVRGPTGGQAAAEPMAAEIRSRVEDFGLSAGVVTTTDVIHDGPAAWVGGLQFESMHGRGRTMLELRTSVSQVRQSGVLGIELGPRIEGRLKRGTVLFLDGKAEAKALRSIETGIWSLPGISSDAAVGVTACTGMAR